MAVLRRPDGSLAFQTSDGLTVPMGERALRELGLELPGLDPAATAMNGEGGSGNVPEQRLDAPQETPGAGGTSGRSQDQGGGVGAPGAPEMAKAEPRPADEAPKPPGGGLRGGGKVEQLDLRQEGGGSEAPPQRQRLQKIPGGDVRTGYTRKVGASDEDVTATKEAIGRAGESERKLVETEADFEASQRAREAELLSEEIAAQRQSLDATRWKRQQAEERIRSEQEELNGERDKVAALEQDPYNYWSGKSTFSKVMAFLGAAAGGLLAGMQGGENQFLTRLDKIIADDKAERAAKVKARKSGYQVRQDALDKFAEKHDPAIAEREIEARQRLLSAAMMRQHANRTGNQLLMAKMGAMADKVEANARQNMAQVDQELGDQIVEQVQNIPDRYVGGVPAAKEADLHQLSQDEERAGIGATEAEDGEFRDLISDMPQSGEIPTRNTRNIVSRGVRSAADTLGGTGSGSALLDTEAERIAAAKFTRAQNILKHKALGAAQSDKELAGYNEGIDLENTVEGLKRKNAELDRALARRKAGIRAGSKPEVVQEYERRKDIYSPRSRPEGARRE